MNNYQKVSTILLSLFSENSFSRMLLPIDNIIVYVCIGLQYLFLFVNFGGVLYSLGSFLSTLSYFALFLGLLYLFAKQNNKLLYLGLLLFAARELIYVIKHISFGYYFIISWHSLFMFAILLFLGIKVFQYETNNSSNQTFKAV